MPGGVAAPDSAQEGWAARPLALISARILLNEASRPKLDLVLQLLREGDTLKVTRLDRLSRSVLHLVTVGAQLRARGIGLHVIEQGIDTDTMEGRAMFGMLSVIRQFMYVLELQERQRVSVT